MEDVGVGSAVSERGDSAGGLACAVEGSVNELAIVLPAGVPEGFSEVGACREVAPMGPVGLFVVCFGGFK